MRKILCTAAAFALVLTGCGKEAVLLDNNNNGAVVVIETKPKETLPKVRPKSDGGKKTTVSASDKNNNSEQKEDATGEVTAETATAADGTPVVSENQQSGENGPAENSVNDSADTPNSTSASGGGSGTSSAENGGTPVSTGNSANNGGGSNNNSSGGNNGSSGNGTAKQTSSGGSNNSSQGSQGTAVTPNAPASDKGNGNNKGGNGGQQQTPASSQENGEGNGGGASSEESHYEAPNEDKTSAGGNSQSDTKLDDKPISGDEEVNNDQPDIPVYDEIDKPDDNVDEDIYYLEGIVYKNTDGTLIINEPDLSWVTVDFADKTTAKDVNIGDVVLITYDGYLEEGTPSLATDAYSVEITREAECDYELQRFICPNETVDLKFSMLVPKNWSNSNINYPTEGDFTDWGIKFTAEGEDKGIELSWHTSFAVREAYDIKPVMIGGRKIKRYSRDNKWHFYVYDNGYIAANTFYGEIGYNEYLGTIEFMLDTLEFDELSFI